MASQPYSVLVVDGDEQQARHLKTLLTSSAHADELAVSVACSGEELRSFLAKTPPFLVDILFVGLRLKDDEPLSGPDLVQKFFANAERLSVIYLAQSLELIPQAYDTKHVFTLPVPVEADNLEKALDKAYREVGLKHIGDSLVIRSDGTILRVPTQSVLYIESLGHRMLVHGIEGFEHGMYGSLRSLQDILPASFCRTHKSYLVNIEHVSKLSRTNVTLDDGSSIPLSRNYRAPFKKAYLQYFDEQE